VSDDRELGLKKKRGPKTKKNTENMHPLHALIYEIGEYQRTHGTTKRPYDPKWLETVKIKVLLLKVAHPELPWPELPWEYLPKISRVQRVPVLPVDETSVTEQFEFVESTPSPDPLPELELPVTPQPELPLATPTPEKTWTKLFND